MKQLVFIFYTRAFTAKSNRRVRCEFQYIPIKFSVVICTALLIFLLYSPSVSFSQNRTYDEYQVKAAFIYNFLLFTEWPEDVFESKTDPIEICILGQNPFENHLEVIADTKKAKERTINKKQIRSVEEAEGCEVLFVSQSESDKVDEILEIIKNKPILTISDMDNFSKAGGMVQLILIESKVNFVVNLSALNETGLKMSSKLLDLAHKVIKE